MGSRRFRRAALAGAAALALAGVGVPAQAAVVPAAPGVIAPGENVWYDEAGAELLAQAPSFVRQGDTFYMFGMRTSGSNFSGVNVYRSTNLVDWTFVRVALTPTTAGNGLLDGTHPAYRPSVIYNAATSTWVMWMQTCNALYGNCSTSPQYAVATSSSLTGPYSYQGSALLPGDRGSLDGTLFQDTDGSAYWVVNDNVDKLAIYKLTSDYRRVDFLVHRFSEVREGPVLFKRNGRYYVLASGLTSWASNSNVYATATSLAGPWTAFAQIAPNSGNTYDSQSGGVLVISGSRGTSYIFAGDRWQQGGVDYPDHAKAVWMPLRFDDRTNALSIPEFNDTFRVDVAAGEWSSDGTVNDSVTGSGLNRWSTSSGWSRVTAPSGRGDHQGDATSTTTSGATATLTFQGTAVSLHAVTGPSAGTAAVSVDGGSETTVDLYAAAARGDQLVFHRTGLSPGTHTLRVRSTGGKNPASGGTAVAFDRAEVKSPDIEDNATGTGAWQFQYGSGWSRGYGNYYGRSAGSNHYTSGSGVTRTATFRFSGTGVDFYGVVGPQFGRGTVQVDGQAPVPIDEYRSQEHGNQLLWRSPTLTQGSHTLTITSLGTKSAGSSDYYFAVDRVVTRP